MDPLFALFYESICKDRGLHADGSLEHKAAVMSMLQVAYLMDKKGGRSGLEAVVQLDAWGARRGPTLAPQDYSFDGYCDPFEVAQVCRESILVGYR